MKFRRGYQPEPESIPWIPYIVGVGSTLVCLLFATNAYIPKAEYQPFRDIDRTVLRVQASSALAHRSDQAVRAEPSVQSLIP